MKKNLRERAEVTAEEIRGILNLSPDDHPKEIVDAIEQSIINALVEERYRCADMIVADSAHQTAAAQRMADEVRQVKSVLLTRLSSLR